jgi:hypothetical protein
MLYLEKSTAPLGWLIGFAESHGYSYGILPFDREPSWLPTNFNLKE